MMSIDKICTIVHFKCLGSRRFHDLFNHYLFFFSKHNEYCKIKVKDIPVNFSRFLSDVILMICINIKRQWDFIMGKKSVAQL